MTITITSYNALCNLGNNIETIYQNAIEGNNSRYENIDNFLPNTILHAGIISSDLPEIKDENFNIRANKILLKNIELLKKDIEQIKNKYSSDKIGIVCASTNSGVQEYEKSKNPNHYELGNSADFLRKYLKLNGFYSTVSTACSSGIKAFSLARDLLNNNVCDAVIVACVDTLSKVPAFGFNSLEVLSDKTSTPFSKNRLGMNISEASTIFILEKNVQGIEILGIGESTDIYHPTTPDPKGKEATNAINQALKEAKLMPEDIDYINAHGTGTIANDIMEANAIWDVFKDKVPISSTKPLTGHCLGAAAGIEIALCTKLIDNFDGRLYPNIPYDNFDNSLPKINLVSKDATYKKCNICMCNSFGFGGTNAIIILGKNYE